MTRLNVESLEGRSLMSVGIAPASTPEQVVVNFTPPIGSNKGSFCTDGTFFREGGKLFVGPTAPVSGICAVWHD